MSHDLSFVVGASSSLLGIPWYEGLFVPTERPCVAGHLHSLQPSLMAHLFGPESDRLGFCRSLRQDSIGLAPCLYVAWLLEISKALTDLEALDWHTTNMCMICR